MFNYANYSFVATNMPVVGPPAAAFYNFMVPWNDFAPIPSPYVQYPFFPPPDYQQQFQQHQQQQEQRYFDQSFQYQVLPNASNNSNEIQQYQQQPNNFPYNIPPPKLPESMPKQNDFDLHSCANKDTCSKCRKAVKEMLQLPREINTLSYQNQLEEFFPFKNYWKCELFSSKVLQKSIETSNENFQYSQYKRFSKDSYCESPEDACALPNTSQNIDFSYAYPNDGDNNLKDQSLSSEFAPNVNSTTFDTTFLQQSQDNDMNFDESTTMTTPWKKPVVIDPSSSPLYDRVFPSLEIDEKKKQQPYEKKMLRFNQTVSEKTRK